MKAVIFGVLKCALLIQWALITASPQTPSYVYLNQGHPQSLRSYSQLFARQRRPVYPGQQEYPHASQPDYTSHNGVQQQIYPGTVQQQQDYQGAVQQQQQNYPGAVQQYPGGVQQQQDYQGAVQQQQQNYPGAVQQYPGGVQQQQDYQGAGQQVTQDQGNVNQASQQPPQQPDSSDDRAQHYGGNGSPLIFIYPTEGEPVVVHDQKQQRPPMQIFGSFNRPSAFVPDRLQDSQPFFQIPTQILSQPGPIRQWIDNVGNWFSPPRQAMTVLYPTTSTVLVPHFVTVTASCTV